MKLPTYTRVIFVGVLFLEICFLAYGEEETPHEPHAVPNEPTEVGSVAENSSSATASPQPSQSDKQVQTKSPGTTWNLFEAMQKHVVEELNKQASTSDTTGSNEEEGVSKTPEDQIALQILTALANVYMNELASILQAPPPPQAAREASLPPSVGRTLQKINKDQEQVKLPKGVANLFKIREGPDRQEDIPTDILPGRSDEPDSDEI